MADRRPDRRVRRTKHRLKAALLELIQEREYDGITVEEITERADIGRSTFYSHFRSKEDLLFAGFEGWLRSLTEPPPGGDGERRFRFSLPLLEHIRSQRRFFEATIVRGNDVRIRQRFMAQLAELIRIELARMAPSPSLPAGGDAGRPGQRLPDAQAHAVAGAFLGLANWWLTVPDDVSAADVDEVFQRLAVPPVGFEGASRPPRGRSGFPRR